jgi:hypothetical protein
VLAALALGAGGYLAYKEHEKHQVQVRILLSLRFVCMPGFLILSLQRQAQIAALTDWVRDAQARTDAFYQGSTEGPVAWVLNRGHIIPDKAIVGGRDENGEAFYVARAFQEVGLMTTMV